MENRQNHSQFSDHTIRHFLLGQLPASEQALFEEQLFINADLEARLRLAEFELADDYAFKRLTESETSAFRERYLLTADRNQKLNVSQTIRDRFLSESAAEIKPTVYQWLIPWFDLRRPGLEIRIRGPDFGSDSGNGFPGDERASDRQQIFA
jgi:hypothetical protein